MAHFAQTGRIVFSGALPQGERWSTGFWISGPGPTSSADAQAKMDTFFTTIAAGPLDRIREGIPSTGNIDQIRLYWYAQASPATALYITDATTGPIAGTGTATLPLQTSVVVSLRTTTNARSGRGRMYLPSAGRALTNHELTQTQVDNIANNLALILTAGGAVAGATGRAIVNSQVIGNPTPVNRVVVDSRTDVQRRRADSQQVLFSKTTTL